MTFAALAACSSAAGVTYWLYDHFAIMPKWFFGHIVGMLACWCLMVIGGSVYSLIKPTDVTATRVTRAAHGLIMSASCLAGIVGYCCMYYQHAAIAPASQLGLDPGNTTARIAHVWVGYAALAMMLIQGCQGWFKYVKVWEYKLHSSFGVALICVVGGNVSLILHAMLAALPAIQYWAVQGAVMGSTLLSAGCALSRNTSKAREVENPDMYDQMISVE